MKTARKPPLAAPRKRSRAAASASAPQVRNSVAPTGTLAEAAGGSWTFLTNHSHVLISLSRNPSLVLREVAVQVGITERAVQRIIADLEIAGVLEREKVGCQNHYRIRTDQSLRHPIESRRTIGELLGIINRGK